MRDVRRGMRGKLEDGHRDTAATTWRIKATEWVLALTIAVLGSLVVGKLASIERRAEENGRKWTKTTPPSLASRTRSITSRLKDPKPE